MKDVNIGPSNGAASNPEVVLESFWTIPNHDLEAAMPSYSAR